MLPPLPITPPRIIPKQELPTPEIMALVQRVADRHYEEGPGEDSELSTERYPICASLGPVTAHTDEFEGQSIGKLIYGLVLRSDGHLLHTDSMGGHGFPISTGDVYELHPFDRHWTTTPDPEGQLIFAAAFIGPDDSRFRRLERIAHDLRWETLKAMIEFESDMEKAAKLDKAMERERLRGIASVHQ